MANNDEDEFYSDDDLDALPADALSELELKAVRSTQQKNPSMTHGQLQQNHQSLPILFKASVQTLPVQPRYDGRKAQQYAQSVDYPQQPSSDYGNFDDEDLEADLLDAGDFTNLAEQGQTSLVEKLAGRAHSANNGDKVDILQRSAIISQFSVQWQLIVDMMNMVTKRCWISLPFEWCNHRVMRLWSNRVKMLMCFRLRSKRHDMRILILL
jgi:hypothetical protein